MAEDPNTTHNPGIDGRYQAIESLNDLQFTGDTVEFNQSQILQATVTNTGLYIDNLGKTSEGVYQP